jgi:hypothetical protein
MGLTSIPGWDVELPEHPSATIAGYFVLYQPSQAPSAIIANRPPTPIWSSPMARMPRRNCSPRGRDRDTSRSSSAGTNVRIKVLRRDAKNHVVQPIRKKPHAAANPVWMLSLIGGIGSPLQGVTVATSLIWVKHRLPLESKTDRRIPVLRSGRVYLRVSGSQFAGFFWDLCG